MMRISTKTHGIIDYVAGSMLTVLPEILKTGPLARMLFRSAGVGAGVYSMTTDYEMGVVKALPMQAHLALDAASGVTMLGAAALLDDETTSTRLAMAGVGLFEIFAALTTETEPYSKGKGHCTAERLVEYVS